VSCEEATLRLRMPSPTSAPEAAARSAAAIVKRYVDENSRNVE
jgi:hypothetical protein